MKCRTRTPILSPMERYIEDILSLTSDELRLYIAQLAIDNRASVRNASARIARLQAQGVTIPEDLLADIKRLTMETEAA